MYTRADSDQLDPMLKQKVHHYMKSKMDFTVTLPILYYSR